MDQDRLAYESAVFASEVQATIDAVLPNEKSIVSVSAEEIGRYVVRPEGELPSERRIPVRVDGEHLADLAHSVFLASDRVGQFIKTVRSETAIYSTLDRQPLLRLEYRVDMHSVPVAHWQVHAERGAFSHLLARAHAHRPKAVRKPHDISSLHLPVGGERFRPCLEDVLQFLVSDCGVDHHPGWFEAVAQGRHTWLLRQLAASVRDAQGEAARVLRELGWMVTAPSPRTVSDNVTTLSQW